MTDHDTERSRDLQDSMEPLPDLSRSMELVGEVRSGNQGALEELLERYQERLRRIISIRLGARLRSKLEVDDILQEVLWIASGKVQDLELRDRNSLLHWMTKIAENVMQGKIQYFTAQKRDVRQEASLDQAVGASDGPRLQISASQTGPLQKATRSELQRLVDAQVEELEPEDFREVILLRDYQENPWEEVCRMLGRPTVAATQELYRRAHLRLREHMQRRLGGPR